jgi:hypothetical protein
MLKLFTVVRWLSDVNRLGGTMKLRGDRVEVRSKENFLSTLDKQSRLERLPFMPQMFHCCSQSSGYSRVRTGPATGFTQSDGGGSSVWDPSESLDTKGRLAEAAV